MEHISDQKFQQDFISRNGTLGMTTMTRSQVERNGWIRSIGVPLNKEHFREPPPGTGHTVFVPGENIGAVHYDETNPLAGPVDTVKHLWDWSPLGTIALAAIAYKLLK